MPKRSERNVRVGSQEDVRWIVEGKPLVLGAVPQVFDGYATVQLSQGWNRQEQAVHDRVLIESLAKHSVVDEWWLGYLDTGADDIVAPDAPSVRLYWDWRYVLIEGGPTEALTWRHSDSGSFWKGALPNLFFPYDHSWLASTLWDDDWTCVGGSHALIADLVQCSLLRTTVAGASS